jgi:basic membrane protein A
MRLSSKIGLLLAGVLLLTLLLSACGDTTTATPIATTTSAVTTKKLKVGLVTDNGRIDDKGYNQSAWEGLQRAQKELGIEPKYIESKSVQDFAASIQQFIDDKQDVIVTVGPDMADATSAAAKANSSILFIGIDQFQAPDKQLKNLAAIIFEEDKAGFLAGALAAGMSQRGKIGSVLGPKSIPNLLRFGEGYKAGAAYLDTNYKNLVKAAKTQVTLAYHPDGTNAFSDPTWGAQQAQALINDGNDVIFSAAGATGTGAVEVAASQGVYVIGVDTDQYYTLPKAAPKLLSSATKLIGDGLVSLLKDASVGNLKSGNNISPVGLAPFHDTDAAIPAELKDALKKIEAGLKDGSLKTNV